MDQKPLRKKVPYHTFLFIPYVILFMCAQNAHEVRPYMVVRTLVAGMLVTAALFGLSQLVFRNRLKSGVFVTLLLFIMFQYGIVYESLEMLYYNGRWPFRHIHRYLMLAYFIASASMFLFACRTRKTFQRTNYFLNLLIVSLMVFNSFRIAMQLVSDPHEKAAVADIVAKPPAEGETRPNIYHIIVDGYADGTVLAKYYGFDNGPFLRFLEEKGFSVKDSAFANYFYTGMSLAATMNLEYHVKHDNDYRKLTDNKVIRTLKRHGYKIYNMHSGYAVTSKFRLADSTLQLDGPNEFEKSMLKYTVLRLDDLVGLFAFKRLNSQFKKMKSFAHLAAAPRYCFLHFVAPHPPYVYDRNGGMRAKHSYAEHSWEPRDFYTDQLFYVNSRLRILIREIVAADPASVIILQSDHGPWITAGKKEMFEARSRILYAVYPAHRFGIPEATSPVNTYRYIFNELFRDSMRLLPDSHGVRAGMVNDPMLEAMGKH